MQDELKTAALRLAAKGLRVFPLKPGSKEPAISDWPRLATSDPAAIGRVWAKGAWNIGVAMGGGWVGLDIDTKRGKDGFAAARALGVQPKGFVVATPSGGQHVYYRGPDLRNSVGGLADGLDLRGVRGFLVGPGSVLDETQDFPGAYVIVEDGEPEDVPAVIVQRAVAPRERAADLTPAVEADRGDAVERAAAYLSGAAPLAVEGQAGDLTTYKVAAQLKDYGVSADTAVELMAGHWNERCAPPWDYADLQTKVRNAYEYGLNPLGVDHPAANFDGVKVVPPPRPERPPSQWFDHGDTFDVDQAWLFYGILPQAGTGVLVAPSGAGKTFLAIEAARCGATGKPFFKTEPDERFGTLFVFGGTEGSGFPQRLAALGEEGPLPISGTVCGNLAERDALDHLMATLREKAAQILERFGVPVRLIVLETLASSGLLADENSNSEASHALNNLAHLGRQLGAFVWTSHHPAKDGKGARGASAIPSSTDYMLEISRHGAARELTLVKARNAEDMRQLGSFTLVDVELGTDSRGRMVTSKTVSMGEKMTKTQKVNKQAENVLRAVEWAAIDETAELIDGKPAALAATAQEQFGELAGGSYRTDKSNRKRIFEQAAQQLVDMGRLVCTVFAGSTYYIVKEPISV